MLQAVQEIAKDNINSLFLEKQDSVQYKAQDVFGVFALGHYNQIYNIYISISISLYRYIYI